MDIIYEIRKRHSIQKQSNSAVVRDMGLSRPTVRKHLNTIKEPKYEREQPASPKLGPFEEQLKTWLEDESKFIRSRRCSAHRSFDGLQEIGYWDSYLPLPVSGGALLFHLISQLYEKTSLIITTNLSFGEWGAGIW